MTQESFAGACLLKVPFVVRQQILRQLNLREQLSLRQVCRTTRDWIDRSSVVHHVPVTVLKDYGAKTFAKFLEKRPPHIIKSIYIENENNDFLKDPALDYFLRLYSSSVTTLKIKIFFPCQSVNELKFYERFINLSELDLEKISIPSGVDVTTNFPSNFKNLKKLKIGCVKAFPEPPDDLFASALIPLLRQRPMGLYTWELIKFCEKIEYLGYPKTSKYFYQAFIDGRGRGEFGVFCDYVRQRHLQRPNDPNLQFCDFQNEHWSPDAKNALALLKMGNEFGIKYLNMNANQFQYIRISSLIRMYDLPKSTGDCILSFRYFNCLITECLPAVEKISMSASEVNTMLDYSCVFNGPKQFPNLKKIEIIIDTGFSPESETDVYRRARELRDVQILLSHFFYDMETILFDDLQDTEQEERFRKYFSVDSLTIRFPPISNSGEGSRVKAKPEDLPLDLIIKGVPNLKKLKLVGWETKTDVPYRKLWQGLPKLKEVILEDCEDLTPSCFCECSDLQRVSIKKSDGLYGVIDESLAEHFEDKRGMQPSYFLFQSSFMQNVNLEKYKLYDLDKTMIKSGLYEKDLLLSRILHEIQLSALRNAILRVLCARVNLQHLHLII